MQGLFEAVGLPGHLTATWFAGLLRDGFPPTVTGANPALPNSPRSRCARSWTG